MAGLRARRATLPDMLDTLAVSHSLTAAEFTPAQAAAITAAVQQAAEHSDHVTTDQFKAGLTDGLRLPRSRGQVKAFGSRHGVYINIDSCGRCGSRAQRGIQRTCGRP